GLRPSVDALRRAWLAGDVLYDRDGALADECDGHRVEADALARDAASGVGGVQQSRGGHMMAAWLKGKPLWIVSFSPHFRFERRSRHNAQAPQKIRAPGVSRWCGGDNPQDKAKCNHPLHLLKSVNRRS